MNTDTYRFDGWELDLLRGRLLRRGQVVPLRPKAFELLVYLVRHSGRLVPRQELLAAVWPGVHVCDTTLATTMHEVRAMLTRHGDRKVNLRTAHGRGYRLDATVVSAPPEIDGEVVALPIDGETQASACGGFVGRRQLLAEAELVLARARRGFGHALIVSGEVGVGKSSTLLEIARRASAQGLGVHITRCIEDAAAPPAWPWIQLLRSVLGSCAEQRRCALEERYPVALGLMREFGRSGQRERRTAGAGPSGSRFAGSDELAALLHERSREQPQLLVLDDLQHADPVTLQLLRHVILTLAGAPVVVLAGLREREHPADHPLEVLFGELHGAGRVVSLGGLDAREIGELAGRLAGREVKIDVVRALHARTGGNPLFAAEIVRVLTAQQALDDADAVEDVAPPAVLRIEHARLARLGADAMRLLDRAATLGPEFDVADLGAAQLGLSPSQVSALLGAALRGGVLVRDRKTERLRFAQVLTREVLLRGQEERGL